MGIKEKDIEEVVLRLLDMSPEIQRKIRTICMHTTMSGTATDRFTDSNERKEVSSEMRTDAIEQLENQLAQLKEENKQAVIKIQKYNDIAVKFQSKCNALEVEKKNLESKLLCLENDIQKAKSEHEESKQRFRECERENIQLKESHASLSSMLDKAKENIQLLKEQFSAPVILLERYKSLPVSIRNGLSDVICDKDEILFIASCSTQEHLKSIWGYTKKLVGSGGDMNDAEVLKDIFDYFFEVLNNSLSEPMYIRDSVEIGYSFDDDKYDRCMGSSTSGKITQVILRGYKSVNTGKIICRSFVRV